MPPVWRKGPYGWSMTKILFSSINRMLGYISLKLSDPCYDDGRDGNCPNFIAEKNWRDQKICDLFKALPVQD